MAMYILRYGLSQSLPFYVKVPQTYGYINVHGHNWLLYFGIQYKKKNSNFFLSKILFTIYGELIRLIIVEIYSTNR